MVNERKFFELGWFREKLKFLYKNRGFGYGAEDGLGDRPRVVVAGAGFGGLWAARELAKHPVEVLLLDRNNYHTFLPLLYQVAAAELEPEEITYPVRSMLRGLTNIRFIMSEVSGIDFESRVVDAGGDRLDYDYLVLATGSLSHYFGVPGAKEHTFSLKTLEEGISIRNHILGCFECASGVTDPEMRKKLLTFVIIGGGATGVEFGGALIELIKGPLVKDYPEIDPREVEVVIIEGSDRLLSVMESSLGDYAARRLKSLGVSVSLNTMVTEITPGTVHLDNGGVVHTDTVIWTAGVSGGQTLETFNVKADENGRAPVGPTLQLPGHPEVYVVGDLSSAIGEGPHPLLAPVAVQQGVTAAKNIARQVAGEPPVSFLYIDRGTMVVIGRNAAVAQMGKRSFTGFIAWILWLLVHIVKLIGFRNRLLVLINWAWDYFFFERAVRIILPWENKRS